MPLQKAFGAGKCPSTCAEGAPKAFQAEKHPKSCAEGAPRRFRAEKGIISCAEWVTPRLPGRKTPQILRRRCPETILGRKRYHFLRRRLQSPTTSPPSTTIFLFLAILLFLRKINRINLPYRFRKPFEIHRFARTNH